MRFLIVNPKIAVILACLYSPVAANSFVDAWSLDVVINDGNQSPMVTGALFNNLVNPLVDTHSTSQITGAIATAAYNFNWSNISGNFHTDCSLVGTGYPNANANIQTVVCEGKIRITSSVDALLSLDAHMDFALGPGDREANAGWIVRPLPNSTVLYAQTHSAQPAFGDPASGAWDDHAVMTLNAGQQYLLEYGFGVASYPGSGTQSQLSHASAFVNFHLDAVPEPVALAPMAIAALLLRKRRSPYRRRS